MEQPLLAASLRSRADYELVKSYIDLKRNTYSKQFQIIMSKVGEYYQRDASVSAVQVEVLMAIIAETVRNDKHVERFNQQIAEAAASAADVNVRAAVLLAKQQEIGDELAVAITSGNKEKERELLPKYQELSAMTDLDQLSEKGLEVFHDIDLASLIAAESDPSSLIKVYPMSLNDRLDGGAKRGHHIVVFGPVESGKSCTVINMNAGFARQGFRSLYFINEDRPQDIIMRHVANLSGMTKHEILANPRKAQHEANKRGFENILVVSASPGTPQQISDYVDKFQPDCIVVDQLRNLKLKSEGRVTQLEMAATAVRNIAKEQNVLAVSVTQAGDSATGKIVLDTGDVDFSNIGIPAQADVMVGVGFNEQYEAEGLRSFSLPKNKISGMHDAFPVRITPQLSRMSSV